MVKPDHNVMLSRSTSSSMAPPSVIDASLESESESESKSERKSKSKKMDHPAQASHRPDYVLVSAYVLIYLEVGWLILMSLRVYSRD